MITYEESLENEEKCVQDKIWEKCNSEKLGRGREVSKGKKARTVNKVEEKCPKNIVSPEKRMYQNGESGR